MTSQEVVSYVKRILNEKKAGHTGTLDPGASGVLPITLGKATRISEYLLQDKKSYRAEMRLGIKSDTLDKYGNIEKVNIPVLSDDILYKTFEEFKGRILQTPPMYSAVKINGKKLYELARQGITVERKEREAYIYNLNILKIKGQDILFDVTCSKGTYIRSLCSDIGKRLGSDAVMTFLIRTMTGPFKIDDAYTLDELKIAASNGYAEKMILSVETALPDFSRVYLDSSLTERVKNGAGFKLKNALKYDKRDKEDILLLFDNISSAFIAIGKKDEADFIKIEKVLS